MKKKNVAKFSLALLVTFGLAYMAVIFGPSEVFFANVSEFEFVYSEFIGLLILIASAISLILALIITFMPEKVYNILISAEFGIGVAGYLQVMFLNKKLDLLGLNPEGYQVGFGRQIGNACIWAIIMMLVIVFAFLKHDLWKKMVTYVSLVLLCIQLTALFSLCLTAKEEAYHRADTTWYLSGENQYVVSADKNVIVIVLDFFSNQYIPKMESKYPGSLDYLHDFTYYNNMDCTYFGTFPSLAHMLTGQEVKTDMSTNEWFVEIWENDKTQEFYKEAHEQNFVTNVYTPDGRYLCGNNSRSLLEGAVSNIVNASKQVEISYELLLKTMIKMSAYRMAPEVMKPYFYTNMNEYENIVTMKENKIDNDNYEFYESLLSKGLSVDENSNYYIVQHLGGPHVYDTDENGYYKENSTLEETTKGCMVIVEEYLNQLKNLEVYDDATIIITTDHGGKYDSQGIFFIKQPEEKHEEMIVTNAPASYREFIPTIAEALGLDPMKYGQTIYDFKEDELRERTVWIRAFDSKYPTVPCCTDDKEGESNVYYGYTYIGGMAELFESMSEDPQIIEPMKDSFY